MADPLDDEAPVGRILSRREILALLGGSGLAAFVAACASAPSTNPSQTTTSPAAAASAAGSAPPAQAAVSCIVTPALTEGPYFVDEKLDRSDIRESKPGAQLALTVNVFRASGTSCAPLAGAVVDLWHCDAVGVYSDAADPRFNTRGSKFLRGFQTSDTSGRTQFTTIYPGWYGGRAVHIHFKIRTSAAGRTSDFTSQFFFDEAMNEAVFAQAPYKPASGRTRNERDGIYQRSAGNTTLAVTKSGALYTATFNIGLTI